MTLYNLRSPGTITKWDNDGNIEAQYEVSYEGCTCPAGHRSVCRHRTMLPDLLPIANTHWFWDYQYGEGQVVDFNGIPKSHYDDVIKHEEHLRGVVATSKDWQYSVAEGPLKQDTPTPASTPTPSWRRI